MRWSHFLLVIVLSRSFFTFYQQSPCTLCPRSSTETMVVSATRTTGKRCHVRCSCLPLLIGSSVVNMVVPQSVLEREACDTLQIRLSTMMVLHHIACLISVFTCSSVYPEGFPYYALGVLRMLSTKAAPSWGRA